MKISSLKKLLATGILLNLLPAGALADRKWNEANDPKNLEPDYVYILGTLPLSGNLDQSRKGWSDSYWPATRGYIADRWQVPALAFKFDEYDLPKPDTVYRMAAGQLNLLSPAEKFDIVRGKLDFPTAKFFRKKNPSDRDWWRGLCNGWTQASLHYDEPKNIVFTSPVNGIRMPFGSSDIKGLLAYYYAYLDRTVEDSKNPYHGYIGRACKLKERILLNARGGCSDINAGAFHIALTNEIGIRKRAFAMDRDPDTQVWNHPVVGFESKVVGVKTSDLSKDKTPGTVREVTMETTVRYVNELYSTHAPGEENDRNVAPRYEPLGPGNQHYGTLNYRYVLELNSYDRIIGGEWDKDSSYPDFIWRQAFDPEGLGRDTKNFKDDWTLLDAIVKAATQY
jgi:hypothetical protein